MPSLNLIKIIGHGVFASKMHRLPSQADHKPPQNPQQYAKSLLDTNNIGGTAQVAPPFFTPQDPANKLHWDSCNEVGKIWRDFHDTMLDAVKYSHDMWRLQAKFKDLKINAVTALGAPGCLDGPTLESNIKNFPGCVAWTGNAQKLRDAVAKGVSDCFEKWQKAVTVPGLPWYPAFAAFPAPQAPPMPNVPTPLITCPSAQMAAITVPQQLKSAMVNALAQSIKDEDHDRQYDSCFEAIATVLSLGFLTWLPSQQVMLVMGKGPIPTFAPPYVPVGPVVMGDNIAAPGHLMA